MATLTICAGVLMMTIGLTAFITRSIDEESLERRVKALEDDKKEKEIIERYKREKKDD